MDPELHSLASVIERTDARARSGAGLVQIWPTGFELLDEILDGGLRSGNLILLAGPQGQGKTTLALQAARNIAVSGRQVIYFCFEHEPEVLLERLVALEAGILLEGDAPSQERIRRAFEGEEATEGGLMARLEDLPNAVEALKRVMEYQENLHIHRSTGSATTVGVIANAVHQVKASGGPAPLIIVDYLQKVKVQDGSNVEDERVTVVVEDLKDLAIVHGIPVLAISAADKTGLQSGRRMRAQHLRGSTALAYESDVMLILNNKYDIVSRQHLVYGVGNAERFRQWAVVTIEKNRNGRAGLDLEFRKRFDQNRFETKGRLVTEQLIDERLILE
jgi:replicative DNA helicase